MKSGNSITRSLTRLAIGGCLLAALATAIAPVSGQEADRDKLYEDLAAEADIVQRHYGLLKRVVKVVQPSVVHIQANKTSRSTNNALTKIEEAGAGVVVKLEDQHYVVTNRHVIVDAELENIQIHLNDGRFFHPTQVRSDPGSDLAVMYLDEAELVSARLGNSEQVDIGDFVVAVGSPFGLSHSVSYGIISAKGRRDLELGTENVEFQNFLQTDAAINPGNSGGPLLNLRGEVVGINTAIASNSGGNDGIGFSIPVNMVQRIVTDLIKYNRVRRGFVGVTLDHRFTPEKAKAIGLTSSFGARITSVNPESPAERASLQRGDVILRFNDTTIMDDSHLVSEVSRTAIGQVVPIVVFRNGRQHTLKVTVQEREKQAE